jgi:cell wall assembly regulator SMI1
MTESRGSIKDVWRDIERWLQERAAGPRGGLTGPVSAESVRDAEVALGMPIPEQLRASLDCHDGEEPELWLLSNWSLLPLKTMVKVWRRERDQARGQEPWPEMDPFTRGDSWRERWIPFAYDGSGGYLVVDLDPLPAGQVGQIIATFVDQPNVRVAPNLHECLVRYRDALLAGKFEVREGRLEQTSGNTAWWRASGA